MNKEREYCGLKVFVSDEQYNEYKGTLQEQINALQQRIDKTIEYIESFGISNNDLKGLGECPITINDLCKLLEILKGKDE